MNKHNDTITISMREYNQLIEDSNFLSCLIEAGVNNWDGYSEAWQLMKEFEEEGDED